MPRQAGAELPAAFVAIPPAVVFQHQYANLFAKLQFTPEQADAFIKIKADVQDAKAALLREHQLDPATLEGLTDERGSTARRLPFSAGYRSSHATHRPGR